MTLVEQIRAKGRQDSYIAARVAAFVAANGTVRLCLECWTQRTRGRSVAMDCINDPGWCGACGRRSATAVRASAVLPSGTTWRRPRTRSLARQLRLPEEAAMHGTTCPLCREPIVPPHDVVFRADGRVSHVRCPDPQCPGCRLPIAPGQPVLRDVADLYHLKCLMASRRRIAGGSTTSPWAKVFDERLAARARHDRRLFDELLATTRELSAEVAGVRRWARHARATAAARRRAA